jgi:hypothetical protein
MVVRVVHGGPPAPSVRRLIRRRFVDRAVRCSGMKDGGGSMKPRATPMVLALALAALLAGAGGCDGRDLAPAPAAGGSGGGAGGSGGGAGGATGTADAGRDGAGGIPDAGASGSDVAVDAGRDGSDVAADAGAGGSDAAPDAGAPDAGTPDAGDGGDGGFTTSDGMLCPPPGQTPITAFSYVTEYVYPASGAWSLTSNVIGNSWHVSGTVGDYSGFGLGLVGCSRVDASAFRGISFTVSGSVAQGNVVTMGVGTLDDTIASAWLDTHGGGGSMLPGRCIPISGTNRLTQSSCADPTAMIHIQPTPTAQTVLWSDFTGGKPESGVTPSGIVSLYWFFPAPVGVGTSSVAPYPADITIANLAFVP